MIRVQTIFPRPQFNNFSRATVPLKLSGYTCMFNSLWKLSFSEKAAKRGRDYNRNARKIQPSLRNNVSWKDEEEERGVNQLLWLLSCLLRLTTATLGTGILPSNVAEPKKFISATVKRLHFFFLVWLHSCPLLLPVTYY